VTSLNDEAVDFLRAHQRALENGGQPPDPPQELLDRLGPDGSAELIRLVEQQRRRPAPTPQPDSSLSATLPTSPREDRPLATIPGYELLEEIGRGGMSVVYRARELSLNRIVALKMILVGGHADQEQLARFRAEAEAVARLRHPNIVQIFRVGEHEGLPFLALEYVEQGGFDKQLSGAPQPPRWAAEVILTLAQAVQHAHAQGIIHRDLKPANVLVGDDGRLKVTDFGLAKQLDQAGQTVSGTVLGTPEYMAPEQAGGHVRDLGPAADIYALGVILYELLTGRPPFRGSTMLETLDQVRSEEPVPPRRFIPKLPRDLETICLKCLGKSPRDRYSTAAQLAEDLELFLEDRPIKARPIGPLGRAWRWRRRNPVVAALGLGVATLVIVAATSAIIAAFEYRAKADTEARARAALEEQLYANRIAVAERELTLHQDVGLASKLLEQCPERLRGWEWDYLMHLREDERAPITGHEGGLWSAVFSPDGRRIATASIDGTARVWDAATGRLLYTFHGHEIRLPLAPRVPVMCVAFSPDGQYIASGSLAPNLKDLKDISNPRKAKGVVHIWEADSGRVVTTFDQQKGIVDTLAFSPDGSRIASSSVSDENGFAIWDTKTGQQLGLLRGHASHVHKVCFSPDGLLIASGSTDGTVKLWDAATLREVRSIDAHVAPVYGLAFSSDGRRLATASMDGTVGVWDVATGALTLERLRGHTGATMTVAFSPDDRRIATGGYDKTVRLWDAATGVEKITLRGHTDLVTSVAFSPDGRQLVSASFDKEARVWDASRVEPVVGPGLFTLGGHTDRVNMVAFRRDGRLLASSSWDMTVRLWDGENGQAVRTLQGHKGPVWGIAFSPDGKRLASASWDRTARVWDVESGQEVAVFTGHPTPVQGLAFSPDGESVASSSFEGLVKVWDAATGRETASLAGHLFPALAVAFSPDGKYVASGSGDRTVKVWDIAAGREVVTFKGHSALVNSVAFSPDGQRVASASWDQTVRIWDARTGKVRLSLLGHTDRVQGVAFSPDGTLIATASEDKTVRIWDAVTGQEVVPPRRHQGIVWSVAFSPDGTRVAAGCWSPAGWVKTWDARRAR
jgi:WD40 repeat protein/serine/threonine protein kinase